MSEKKMPCWKCSSCQSWTLHGRYRCSRCGTNQPTYPEMSLREVHIENGVLTIGGKTNVAPASGARPPEGIGAVGGGLENLYSDISRDGSV